MAPRCACCAGGHRALMARPRVLRHGHEHLAHRPPLVPRPRESNADPFELGDPVHDLRPRWAATRPRSPPGDRRVLDRIMQSAAARVTSIPCPAQRAGRGTPPVEIIKPHRSVGTGRVWPFRRLVSLCDELESPLGCAPGMPASKGPRSRSGRALATPWQDASQQWQPHAPREDRCYCCRKLALSL